MTVQQNPAAALAQVGNQLQRLASSPIRRWQQTSVTHKAFAIAAGAGMAWWLHKKGMDDLAVAAAAVGAAYGTSAIMHYPAVMQTTGQPQQAVMNPQALPPAHVNGMAARAQSALQAGNGALPAPAAKTPAQPQVVTTGGVVNQNVPPQPVASAPMGNAGRRRKDPSRFDALG